MEAFGVGILIFMLIIFGVSSIANAYEASQRFNRSLDLDDEDNKE